MKVEIDETGIKLNFLWLKTTVNWENIKEIITEYNEKIERFVTFITTNKKPKFTDVVLTQFDSTVQEYPQLLHKILNKAPYAIINLTTEIIANFPQIPPYTNEKEYEERLGYNPDDIMARLNLTYIYLQQVELKKAIKQLKEVIKRISTNFEAYFTLGSILLIKGEPEKAIDYFEQALLYNSNNLPTKRYLANAYFLTGKIDKSISLLEETIKTDPYYFESYIDLSENLSTIERYDEAISKLENSYKLLNKYLSENEEKLPDAKLGRLKRIEHTIQHKLQYITKLKTDTNFRIQVKAKDVILKTLTILFIITMIVSIIMKLIEILH